MRCIRDLKLSSSVFLFFLLFGWQTSILAEDFTFAAEDSWPPFAKADGSGLSRDIIERALSYSNSTASFIIVPYARALKMAENGQVDGAYNVTKQANTSEKFIFGEEPLFQVPASFYYPLGSQQNYTGVDQMPNGIGIAVINGYEYGDLFEKHRKRFKEIRVTSQRQIINLLVEDKVHLAIMFDDVASYTLNEMGLKASAIRKGHLNHVSDIYVAFSPKAENIEQKIKLFDAGLRQIKAHK